MEKKTVLVILAHPDGKNSFNAAIARTAVAALEESGYSPVLRDLYAEGFDPVMTLAEATRPVDEAPDAMKAEMARELRESRRYSFQYDWRRGFYGDEERRFVPRWERDPLLRTAVYLRQKHALAFLHLLGDGVRGVYGREQRLSSLQIESSKDSAT